MSLVSIIVPVFNVEDRLSKCIESLRNQTIKDIEIILVDDGSTDKSAQICNQYSKVDKRVKSIRIKNSGVSSARNTGLNHVNSLYVMFVDSDDEIEETLVEKLLNSIKINNYDLAICGYNRIFLKRNEVSRVENIKCKFYEGDIKGFLQEINAYVGSPILQSPCWKLFKTRIITDMKIKFPLNMSYGEDTFFVYEYLAYTKSVIAINEELYNYFIYEKDTLSRIFRMDKYNISILLNDKLKKLILLNDIIGKEQFFSMQICNAYVSSIESICTNSKLDRNEKYNCIKNMNDMDETKTSFIVGREFNIQNKILSILIKYNLYKFEIMYFNAKYYTKTKLNKIYKVLWSMIHSKTKC